MREESFFDLIFRNKFEDNKKIESRNNSRVGEVFRIDRRERVSSKTLLFSLTMAAPSQANAPPPTAEVDEFIQLLMKDGKRRIDDVSMKQE